METSWCEEYDGQAAADAFVVHHARLVAAEAREFVFYAHWADLHAPDAPEPEAGSRTSRVLPGTERPKTLGGDGTPDVMEFAAAELAPLAGVAIGTIDHKIRDSLDVRHRHPLLWRRTLQAAACDAPDADPALAASMVPIWQVRKIASACHRAGLTLAQARWVDAVTTPRLGHCGFTQFTIELEAAIIEVDPAAAAQREQAEAMRRYVTKGQTNEHGLSTLVAKVEAGDAVAFLAMVNLLADCLAADGDTTPADVRRSKAIGLIANPAAALTYLIAHGYGQLDNTNNPDSSQPAGENQSDPERDGAGGARDNDDDDGDGDGDGDDGERRPETRGGQGVLDLFADRRVRGAEGTQPADGAREDVPGPWPLNSRRNHDFHHPQPSDGPDEPDEPDVPDPGEPPTSGPVDPSPPGAPGVNGPPSGGLRLSDTGGLRSSDLHPAFDDSTDPGENSAHAGSGALVLSRAADLVRQLATSGILEKVTRIPAAMLRPKGVLYVHVHATSFTRDATGVARLEDGHGPTTANRAYQLLGHRHVDVTRVIDLADQRAVEAYEVPADLREALHLLRPASVFPFAAHHGETKDRQDADHTVPYVPKDKKKTTTTADDHDGDTARPEDEAAIRCVEAAPNAEAQAGASAQPGHPAAEAGTAGTPDETADPDGADGADGELPQTRLDNLGFLTRRQHRVKTFARGWIHHQPKLGVHVWRTRYGYWFRVDHTGSHPLGKHPAGTTDDDLLQIEAPSGPGDSAAEIRRVMTVLGAIDPVAESPLEHQLLDLVTGHQPA